MDSEHEGVPHDRSAVSSDEYENIIPQKAFKENPPSLGNGHKKTELVQEAADVNEEEKELDDKHNRVCTKEKVWKVLTTIAILIACTLVNSCLSMLAPFYPEEADARHVSSVIVGTVISITPLVVSITAPILGYLAPDIGVRFMLNSGLFLVGGSYTLIGCLHAVKHQIDFIVLSLLLRIVEGFGSAAFYTGSISAACGLFPSSTGTIMGLIELCSAVGFLVGPPIGGILHQVGGFKLPFLVSGGLTLIFFLVFLIILRKSENTGKKHIPIKKIWELAKNFNFLTLAFVVIVSESALVYYLPSLSLFLTKSFHLNSFQLGLIFLPPTISYMISSIVAGQLTDRLNSRWLLCIGLFASGICYFFVGPAPYITTHKSLAATVSALMLVGIGCSLCLVPMYKLMFGIAREIDPDTEDKVLGGVISGLLSGLLFFGEFAGPELSGILATFFTFEESCSLFGQFVVACGLLITGMSIIDYIFKKSSCKKRKKQKNTHTSTEEINKK